jgi:hypothetical protein
MLQMELYSLTSVYISCLGEQLRMVRSLLARMRRLEIKGVASQYGGDDLHLDEDYLFGPEQPAAYARESAEGAASICTIGCCEERVMAFILIFTNC